jgi:hypothetical protein
MTKHSGGARLSPVPLLVSFTALLLMAGGCWHPAPMTNTILAKASAPDGSSSAVLIRRYRHTALSNDVFYVVLIPTGADIQKFINEEDIGKSALLVATSASRVKLQWEQDHTLHVICGACGLEAIDIMTKRGQAGQNTVVYDGFPQHTAYD